MALKSGFERSIVANLTGRGVAFQYEGLVLPYTLSGEYNPDFMFPNGLIVEAKGLLDRDSKRKMQAVKEQHPDRDIRFMFMDPNKRIPGTKSTHAQWAEKNGWLWCSERIPDDWLT